MSHRKIVVVLVALAMVTTAFFSVGQGINQIHSRTSGGTIRTVSGTTSLIQTQIPANVVYSIPVSLYNYMPLPTVNPYNQIVVVNSSLYSKYEASNLQNVEWFTQSGQIIPSWIEYNDSYASSSTTYWLKVPAVIGANSAIVVYLGFASVGTDLFSVNGNEGLAPSLTTSYGQYDNGAVVFPVYFNGTTPLSRFSVNNLTLTSQSMQYGNGKIQALNFSGQTNVRATGWIYTGSNLSSGNFILGASFKTGAYNFVEIDMLDTNSSNYLFPTGEGVGIGHVNNFDLTTVNSGSWGLTYAFNASASGWSNVTVASSPNNLTINYHSSNKSVSNEFYFNSLYQANNTWIGSFWADHNGYPMSEWVNYAYAAFAPPYGEMPSTVVNATRWSTLTVEPSGLGANTYWYLDSSGVIYSWHGNQPLPIPVPYGEVNLSFHVSGYYAFPPNMTVNVSTNSETVYVQFSHFQYINPGYLKSTLYLGNGTYKPGSPPSGLKGNGTSSLAYASDTGFIYATEPESGKITYFNSSGVIMGSISLGQKPGQMLYDPANTLIYVAEPGNSSIAVINTTTETVTSAISTSGEPLSMSLDSVNNSIYAIIRLPSFSDVIVINASTNSVQEMYTVNIPLPQEIIFDPQDGYGYIISNNLTYIGVLQSGGFVTDINLPSGFITFPYATLDPFTQTLYVSCYEQSAQISELAAINVSKDTVSSLLLSIYPYDEKYALNPFYDQYNNLLYVTSARFAGTNVLHADGSPALQINTTYSDPYSGSWALSPSGSSLYFPETGANSVAFLNLSLYVVTFIATGLITGETWGITLGNMSRNSTANVISFVSGSGSFSYSVWIKNSTGTYYFSNSSVFVGKSNVYVNVPLTPPPTGLYSMNVREVGLPFGQPWTVKVNGHNFSQTVTDISLRNEFPITFSLPAGGFNYSISSSNYVVVSRQEFLAARFPGGYNVNDYISYYQALNSSGSMNATYATFVVFFLPSYYRVSFHETGLAPGTFWDVIAGFNRGESSSVYVNLSLTNGTFNYSIGTTGTSSLQYSNVSQVFGYSVSPASGVLNVSGKNITINIIFTKLHDYYTLNITYRGFPNDYVYGASLRNRSEYSLGELGAHSAESNSIYFALRNGTYDFLLSGISANRLGLEQDQSYTSMTVTINGADSTVIDTYVPSHGYYAVNLNITGLPHGIYFPLNIMGTPNGGNSALDVIENTSHFITLELSNGSYSISYQHVQNPNYYLGTEFYWNLTPLTTAGIFFNSSGFLKTQGSIPLNLNFITKYYLKSIYFNVSGKGTSLTLKYYREYNVSITINGPDGGGWSAVIGNSTFSTLTHTLFIHAVNGTYGYSVELSSYQVLPTVSGNHYLVSPSGGNLTVNGSDVTINVTSKQLFTLEVISTIPKQLTSLEITVDGSSYTFGAHGSSLNISLPNGTYRYSLQLPAGFKAANANGTVSVAGHNAYIVIYVKADSMSHIVSEHAFDYIVSGLSGLAIALAVIATAFLRRDKVRERKK